MRVTIISGLLTLLFAAVGFVSNSAYSQSHPDCQYTASDSDGDGYGWENRKPRIITDSSSTATPPMQCTKDVETARDGMGWQSVMLNPRLSSTVLRIGNS